MSTTTAVTEADVLEAAIKQFEKKGGYTPNAYFVTEDGFDWENHPEREVVQACAIGGVEYAIYKLTGKQISEDVRGDRGNGDAGAAYDGKAPSRQKHIQLYAKVMKRLNRITRELYPMDSGGKEITDVEQLTLRYSQRAGRTRVLKVFRTALEEAQTSS